MHLTSFKKMLLIGAGIFAFILVANVLVAYVSAVSLSTQHLLRQFIIVPLCLGWVGLQELRRLGKRKLVIAIQFLTLMAVVPVVLHPSSLSYIQVSIAAAVMFAAFILALWHRRHAGEL